MTEDNLPAEPTSITVEPVTEADLPELLVLMRGYCDFYEVSPADADLLSLCRALLADPAHNGVQLIARGPGGEALGFATLYWTWSTASAAPLATMNDLFVAEGARGSRIGERLIEACLERCAQHGAHAMEWQTALDNVRAQALYDRMGGRREQWLDYSLPVPHA